MMMLTMTNHGTHYLRIPKAVMTIMMMMTGKKDDDDDEEDDRQK